MVRTVAAFSFIALLTLFTAFAASAQSAREIMDLFGGVMRSAIAQAAQAEWRKLPPAEMACVDQALRNRNSGLQRIIEQGIAPSHPRVSDIRLTCQAQIPEIQRAQSPGWKSAYAVESLSLGSPVSSDSTDYREYRCQPSEQFGGFIRCEKSRKDKERRGQFTVWYSILHSADGRAYYINRYQEPAFWGASEVQDDIQRLARKFGEQPRLTRLPARPGLPNGVLAQWGAVSLQSVSAEGLGLLAQGKSAQSGILADFIGNFRKSVKEGLPIYRIAGGPGFVWIASYDQNGRGTLRFFAVDASAFSSLPGSFPPPKPEIAAAPSPPPTPEIAAAPSSPARTPKEGLEDIRRNAQKGDATAQFKLGTMYASGEGVTKDEIQAVAWFGKAAQLGNADAQYALALRYDNGQGVDKDGSQAVDWYQKAAAQGHQDAAKRLAEASSIVQFARSIATRVEAETITIPNPEMRMRVEEAAARLAVIHDKMPISHLYAVRAEADNAARMLDEYREFRRVSEIAHKRVSVIDAELAQITSDAPIVLEIQDAIKAVKAQQVGSNLRALQDAMERLNKVYDSNRQKLQRWKFDVH